MMRADHLTVEEIIKYIDTSDLSEEYLLWMEEVSEHLLTCDECQRRLRRALIVDSICEDGGLEEGLRLLAEEEKIREKIGRETAEKRKLENKTKDTKKDSRLKKGFRQKKDSRLKDDHLLRVPAYEMDEGEGAACAQIINIPQRKVEIYDFHIEDLLRRPGVARGADAENKSDAVIPDADHPIIPEICGDKLIVKVSGELVYRQLGSTGQRFNVVLCRTEESPIRKEAFWNEAGGYYVAKFDRFGSSHTCYIYLEKID